MTKKRITFLKKEITGLKKARSKLDDIYDDNTINFAEKKGVLSEKEVEEMVAGNEQFINICLNINSLLKKYRDELKDIRSTIVVKPKL